MKRLFKPGDAVTAAVIAAVYLLLCVFLRPEKDGARTAEVAVDGKTVYAVDLDSLTEETELTFGGCVIAFSREGARFISSKCANQLCVRAGLLSLPGDSMACVPERVSVEIVGASGADAVAY